MKCANGISRWRMRATDDGKYRRRDAERRPFRGTEAPITCVHNVEILTRFTWTLAVHASRIPHGIPSSRGRHGEAGWKAEGRKKKEEEERRRRRRKKYEERPHYSLPSPCIRGPPAPSCTRRVVPLVLEFLGTSGVRVGRLPRSADALEFYQARSFYLQ